MNLSKNNRAVSQLIGYILTLGITASVVSVTLIVTDSTIDDRASNAAIIFAENLAARVSDAILNVCIMKDQYPNSNYSISINIPGKLVDRYNYYIDLSNDLIYVNSTDGKIKINETTFNAPNNVKMDVNGRIYGSQQKLKISCEKSNYIYKFDFGTNSSDVLPGYTKVTGICNNLGIGWHDKVADWKYRTDIKVSNPLESDIGEYRLLIQLNDENFGHYLANPDGSDIRFFDESGKELYYWIERWHYPGQVPASRIWVKLNSTPVPESYIYMYYGNENEDFDFHHSGQKTFLFFDDFEGDTSSLNTNWTQYKSDTNDLIYVEDGKLYLENSAAVTVKSSAFSRKSIQPYVIDVKAKATGAENGSEASMFARFSSGTGAPYKNAYVFSSNNFDFNSSTSTNEMKILESRSSDVITWLGGTWYNPVKTDADYSGEPLQDGWNRLRFIINDHDCVGVRYLYNLFTIDGYGLASGCNNDTLERFGLCTLVPDSGAVAQYDWIFVYNYESFANSSGNRKDSEPYAYLQETHSKDFRWDNNLVLDSGEDENGKDFVFYDGDATFFIANLSETTDDMKYSLTFNLGNKSSNIDDLQINLTDVEGFSTKTISVEDFSNYSSLWTSNIVVTDGDGDNLGDLEITFEDTSATDYWSLREMTIELSDRIIKVEDG